MEGGGGGRELAGRELSLTIKVEGVITVFVFGDLISHIQNVKSYCHCE